MMENFQKVCDMLPSVILSIKQMQSVKMSIQDQVTFAQYAVGLRWNPEDIKFPLLDLLTCRHQEQRDPTVWNILNRVQENTIKGFRYFSYGKIHKVRSVKSLDSDLKINQALWKHAESLIV